MKRIYFDMDGTLVDLYGVPDWMDYLRDENPLPYRIAPALVNMERLEVVCNALAEIGYTFGVITWLSKESTADYDEATTSAKMDWIGDKMPYLSDFIAVPYGFPKHKAVKRAAEMWLIDDNEKVRKAWNTPKQRKSIDANGDIIAELLKLLREERGKNGSNERTVS